MSFFAETYRLPESWWFPESRRYSKSPITLRKRRKFFKLFLTLIFSEITKTDETKKLDDLTDYSQLYFSTKNIMKKKLSLSMKILFLLLSCQTHTHNMKKIDSKFDHRMLRRASAELIRRRLLSFTKWVFVSVSVWVYSEGKEYFGQLTVFPSITRNLSKNRKLSEIPRF